MELGLGGSVSAPFIDLNLYFEIVLQGPPKKTSSARAPVEFLCWPACELPQPPTPPAPWPEARSPTVAVLQILLGLGSALEEVCEKAALLDLLSGTVVPLGVCLWQIIR